MLIAFDYKSFHVLTLGFEAKDARYMRMARMDMHSYFALCGLLKLEDAQKMEELPDDELKAKLRWYRKQSTTFPAFGGWDFERIRNEKAKKTILGIGYGQMEYSLFRLNPESFTSPGEGRVVLNELNQLYPKPEAWRQAIRVEADRNHKLITRHGFVRYFWDVFQRRPLADNYEVKKWRGERVVCGNDGSRWLETAGDDHEACIAFLPANDAFGIIRSRMAEIGETGLDERFGLCNQIHDSLVFDCRRALTDECLQVIPAIMQRPSEILIDPEVAPGGLWCAVDAKIGLSLDKMEEVKIA